MEVEAITKEFSSKKTLRLVGARDFDSEVDEWVEVRDDCEEEEVEYDEIEVEEGGGGKT